MSNKTQSQNEHKGNQGNANKGTNGTNKEYAKVHGNRGKQLDKNNSSNKK